MAIAAGTTIGRYEIVGEIGQGGMAVVYKARQPSLDRVVALKVIRAGYSEDPEFLERFKREARAVARLDHPNVVQVYDFDQVDSRALLAMQFLDRGTLKERMTEAARAGTLLSPDVALRVIDQVAAGLAYAHDQGIVHRDVKPANVMFTHDERAVVTDFGIARMVGGGTQLTATGVGIGTPEYMSPEQGQGGELDARSDVYSLGVVAYELLTGKLPFTGDTPFAVVLKHVRDPLPPASTVNPSLSLAVDAVLARALAKDPAERYAEVTELAQALRDAVGAPSVTLPTIRTTASEPTRVVEGTTPGASRALWIRRAVAIALTIALVDVFLADLQPRLATIAAEMEQARPSISPGPTFGAAPTATPVPTHPYPVRLTPSQVIMPASELGQSNVTVERDNAVGATGWERDFTTGEFFHIDFRVYVLPPPRTGSADLAARRCDLSFSDQPQVTEVTAEVVGDGAKACVYHWSTNVVDWFEYMTATRNVTIVVSGEPRTAAAQGGAMARLVQLARQQIAIIDRVAPP